MAWRWEGAVAKRYRVTLTAEEREALGRMISRGKGDARRLVHARVLLQADASEGGPDWRDTRIAEAVRVSVRTIERVRQRFVEYGGGAAAQAEPPRGNTDLNNNKQFSGPVASQMPRCAHPYSATVPEGPAAGAVAD